MAAYFKAIVKKKNPAVLLNELSTAQINNNSMLLTILFHLMEIEYEIFAQVTEKRRHALLTMTCFITIQSWRIRKFRF